MHQIAATLTDALLPSAQLEAIGQYLFFHEIFRFIDEEIMVFQANMLGSMMAWVSGTALVLVTMWVFWQGYRVIQGQARNAMELVADGTRAAFIATLAMTMTVAGANAYDFLSNQLPSEITEIVTGENESAGSQIDDSMAQMEVAMVAIDAFGIAGDGSLAVKEDKDRAMWMAGVGIAGPALVGGALQVLYKVALALFVGFAPLFILSLLFKQTQSLFQKWLLYGIGTMFSFSLMAFMSLVVKKVVLAVSAALIVQYEAAAATPGATAQSVSSMAMLQGGIGLLMTLALVGVPPVAAYFFQGTLGSYMAYSVFGGAPGAGQRPGEQGYRGQASPTRDSVDGTASQTGKEVNAGTRVAGHVAPGNADVTRTDTVPNRLRG